MDKQDAVFLGHLSNRTLARILMGRLWRIYDNGGISMGRTMRAGLLESVLWLNGGRNRLGSRQSRRLEQIKLWDIARFVAEERLPRQRGIPLRRSRLPREERVALRHLKYWELTYLALWMMLKWYRWWTIKAAEQKELFFPQADCELIRTIMGLIGSPSDFAWLRPLRYRVKYLAVVDEGERRSRLQARTRLAHQDRKLFF